VLTVLVPPIFAAYITFPELVGLKGAVGGGLLVAALPPVLAHTARNLGKRLEPELWKSWGGKPTTRLLRHRDGSIPEPTKRRYFLTLAHVGIQRPTKADEVANPNAADIVYDSAGDWLRRHTRRSGDLSLVAAKNAAYGLARNLLGVRWIGFTLALAIGMAETWLTYQAALSASPKLSGFAAAATVNLLAAAFWLLAVRSDWVRFAADAYASAILECLEPEGATALTLPPSSPARKSTKRKTSTEEPSKELATPMNKIGA